MLSLLVVLENHVDGGVQGHTISIRHSMKHILETHTPPRGKLGRGHNGLYNLVNNSFHFKLQVRMSVNHS